MLKMCYSVLFVLFSLVWVSCTKVDIAFGEQYLDNGYTQVIKVDTFAVELSSILVDSFVTSGKGVSMVGSHADPVFGKIDTENYLELAGPVYTEGMADSFRSVLFDSLVLILKPDGSYIGDTLQPLEINVHRLSEPILPYTNDILSIYNTRRFSVQPDLLGKKTILIRPGAGNEVMVRLRDDMGKNLLRKYQDPNDPDIKSNEAFLQYFYGLRISASAGSQLIFGAKDSLVMRLFYQKQGLHLESKTMDFTLLNKSHHFNYIRVDRSATVLKDLAIRKQINSTETGNTAYTMYAAGVMAKLRFPTVRDVLKLPNFVRILKATLVVRPVRGSYGTNSYVLPPQLRLAQTTQLNLIGDDITSYDETGYLQTQTGGLRIDNLYGENTDYAYDLTRYLKSAVTEATNNQNGLLVIPPGPALETQFGRLVAGNRNHTAGKMELLIVYAAVQ
ncbi:MAG: DUF4270 family protein [Chitinophagaceae bacterium]|nr:MAG: DUF4270 family protein [Chitinophagaceae bacterium]